jgi:glycosyltransferase involved in cell wall biosynthesis
VTYRVLLDATPLPAKLAGVGYYVAALTSELARRDDVELHVAVKDRDLAALSRRAPGAAFHPQSISTRPMRIVWEQTALPLLAKRVGAQIFHGPHYTLPLLLRCPGVVTFHDPTFFTNPELHERTKVGYFTRMARLGAKRAARVIAVSQYARRGAVRYGGANPERVDVVYLGVDVERYSPQDGPSEQDEGLRARLGVRRPYLFWVGTIEPRKDLLTLLEAFAAFSRSGADHRLVLGGQPGWGSRALELALDRFQARERVVRLGYLAEDQKIALYRGADALVYPSIAEGFGLQVLEAMGCGCPVITTTGSAPEEIAGEAAELVPPRDPQALRAAIERVIGDPGRANALREKGMKRAGEFTWERTAGGTVQSYWRAVTG